MRVLCYGAELESALRDGWRCPPHVVVSRAHEVVQVSVGQLTRLVLTCRRCGLTGSVDDLFGDRRCMPHLETATSGWKHEP